MSKTDSLGRYLFNLNLFSAEEFELIEPIEEELPSLVQSMNWRIELKSAWRNKKLTLIEELLQDDLASKGNENRILAREYKDRLRWKQSLVFED